MWCLAQNDHVINVTPSKGPTRENLVQHSLKLSKCILEAKWKKLPMVKLILSIMINSLKCGFHLISRKLWELVIATTGGEEAKAIKPVELGASPSPTV